MRTNQITNLIIWMIKNFRHSLRLFVLLPSFSRGFHFSLNHKVASPKSHLNRPHQNDLRTFFNSQLSGRGIWKWDHYFEIYDRYLAKFRHSEAVMVEIGIYSGGSLLMWQNYFGEKIKIIGVDIEQACKAYEGGQIFIEIGDQGDLQFWEKFKTKHTNCDIVIDDGGHKPNQQINTFISLFDTLNPGGVYICEDVHGQYQEFAQFCLGLSAKLGEAISIPNSLRVKANHLQRVIKAVHIYPYMYIIEKLEQPREELFSQKNGTEWQPFYDR